MRIFCALALVSLLMCASCSLKPTASSSESSGLSLHGNVHGGQQPVVGAHVYLMAANSNGYGSPSLSLLRAAQTGASDGIGSYVTTNSNGGFDITGDYSCTPGSQVYLYAVGGDPGAGVNSAAGFLAVLGQCPAEGNFASATPFLWVNEVSTVAAAYAIAGFAVDATHVSSSGTALAKTGISNAFASAANLVNISSGVALAVTPAGNGFVPQTQINGIANLLAACVNSTGPSSTPCSTLFTNARSNGSSGTTASDTATAAINIAHNVNTNVHALYLLVSGTPPFQPSLSVEPNDFAIALRFTGGGLAGGNVTGVAIDAAGNAWFTNILNRAAELSNAGVPISPATGFTGGGLGVPYGIAIDGTGNAWIANLGNSSVTEFSRSGTPMSPATGFAGGGINAPYGIAVDGTGDVWIANSGAGISKLSATGTAISPAGGYVGGGISRPYGIAIDSTGSAWTTNDPSARVAKLSSSGVALSPGNGFAGGVAGIAIDASGNAWIANGSPGVTELSNSGATLSPPGSFLGAGGALYSQPYGIAIDGAGNVWVAGEGVTALSNTGTALFPGTGMLTDGANTSLKALAVDSSGNVWVANISDALEYVGVAVPVVIPLAAGIANNTLGTRP